GPALRSERQISIRRLCFGRSASTASPFLRGIILRIAMMPATRWNFFQSRPFSTHVKRRRKSAPIGHRGVRSLRQAGEPRLDSCYEFRKRVLMSLQNEIGDPTRRVLLVEDEALVAMIAAD